MIVEAIVMTREEVGEIYKMVLHNFVHIHLYVLATQVWATPMYFWTKRLRALFVESVLRDDTDLRLDSTALHGLVKLPNCTS